MQIRAFAVASVRTDRIKEAHSHESDDGYIIFSPSALSSSPIVDKEEMAEEEVGR